MFRMKNKLLYFILLLCLPVFAQTSEEAHRLFNVRQFTQAAKMYEVLLREDPENALYNYLFAYSMYSMGNLDLALKHFKKSGRRFPMVNFYMGEIFSRQERFNDAIAAYRRHLATVGVGDRTVSITQQRIAQIEKRMVSQNEVAAREADKRATVDLPVAVQTPREAVRIDDRRAQIAERRNISRNETNAIVDRVNVDLLTAAQIQVLAQRADSLFGNRQFAEAAKIYETLLRQDPENQLHNYFFALCMYEVGNMNLALRHFQKSGPRFPLANFYIGEIHFANNEFGRAAAAYRSFLQTLRVGDERIPDIEQKIAQAERMSSQPRRTAERPTPARTVETFERPNITIPASAKTPAEANRLFTSRQYAEAAVIYEFLLQGNPNSALFNYRFARCMYEMGNLDIAYRYFRRSGNRYPLTNFYLGSIFYQNNEFDKSITAYRTYLATLRAGHPRIPDVRRRIADAERGRSLANRTVETPAVTPSISESRRLTEAERLFNHGRFAEAGRIYEELLRENPRNESFNFHFAVCMYETGNMESALKHFERSGTGFPLTNFYLGNIFFLNYEFDKAVTAYRRFLQTLRTGDKRIPNLRRRIAQAEQAARMLLRVEDIAIIDSLVVDRVDFLSRINSERFNHEVGSLTQERIRVNEHRTEDKITFTRLASDRMLSSNLHNGKMNIFTSHRLLNDWSAPMLLPAIINSPNANENYPFLMSDGVTVFFASDGENSIGGYDIFITRHIPASNSYLPPENMGMPFNSPYNDFMLVIDEVNNIGWFASDRYQPDDKIIIYFFIPNKNRILVQSQNAEEIRSRAQLRTFRQAKLPKDDTRLGIIQAMQSDRNQPDFSPVIIDNTIQIIQERQIQEQSRTTRLNRREVERLVQQVEEMRIELNELWQKYVNIENAAERANVVSRIRALEREIQKNQQLLQQQR